MKLHKLSSKEISVLTCLRNVINEDGGTPGFDVLAVLTTMLSVIKESCARCNAFNVPFREDLACKGYMAKLESKLFS